MIHNAPSQIWLQTYTEGEDADFHDLDDVTWTEREPEYDDDICYIRAGKKSPFRAERDRYRAALEEIRDADYGTDVQDSDFESGLKQGLYAASKIAHRALHPEEE